VITASQDSFQLISAEAQELMRVGLVDHVHCALVLGKWKELLSFEHMRQETGRGALGPEFIGLVPMVKQKLGPNFQVIQGHRCVGGAMPDGIDMSTLGNPGKFAYCIGENEEERS
jgi:hypothetical protein